MLAGFKCLVFTFVCTLNPSRPLNTWTPRSLSMRTVGSGHQTNSNYGRALSSRPPPPKVHTLCLPSRTHAVACKAYMSRNYILHCGSIAINKFYIQPEVTETTNVLLHGTDDVAERVRLESPWSAGRSSPTHPREQ